MATLKRRLARLNDAGVYEPVYLETSSDLVVRPETAANRLIDGATAEEYMLRRHKGYPIVPILTKDPNLSDLEDGEMWIVKS